MIWTLLAHQFRTVVQFQNQTELAQFVLEVARLADQLDHHPDLSISHCSELRISIYSHDEQRITPRDHFLKDAITELYHLKTPN
jgi:4a-hydroxytetrahydrobiopterin dehydratase